jgi:hypothetical protein
MVRILARMLNGVLSAATPSDLTHERNEAGPSDGLIALMVLKLRSARDRIDGGGFGTAINHPLKPHWSVVLSLATVSPESTACSGYGPGADYRRTCEERKLVERLSAWRQATCLREFSNQRIAGV